MASNSFKNIINTLISRKFSFYDVRDALEASVDEVGHVGENLGVVNVNDSPSGNESTNDYYAARQSGNYTNFPTSTGTIAASKGQKIVKNSDGYWSVEDEFELRLTPIGYKQLIYEKKEINSSDGTLDVTVANYYTTESYIPVPSSGRLHLFNVRSIAFYSAENEGSFIDSTIHGAPIVNTVIEIPESANYFRYSVYGDYPTSYVTEQSEEIVQDWNLELFTNQLPPNYLIKSIMSNYRGLDFKGAVNSNSIAPSLKFFNDAWLNIQDGTTLGVEAKEGDVLSWRGEAIKKLFKRGFSTNTTIKADVCIVGGGSGGIGAAYPLVNSGLKVVVIEPQAVLGGNATAGCMRGWVPGQNSLPIRTIYADLLAAGKATGDINNSWLRSIFSATGTHDSLNFDPDYLAQYYYDLLTGDSNFTVLLQHEFVDVLEYEGGEIKEIYVKDLLNGQNKSIEASLFIDNSTNASLVRSVCNQRNVDYYFGEEPKLRFNETLQPVNPVLKNMNAISLMFEIENARDDSELLDAVTTVYDNGSTVIKPSYIIGTGSVNENNIVNCTKGITYSSWYELEKGRDLNYAETLKRTIEYWKYIKLSLIRLYNTSGSGNFGAFHTNYRTYGWKYVFPLNGVRESVRIVCDYMMKESDLEILVNTTNAVTDHIIAYSTHVVDFHYLGGKSNTAIETFNSTNLRVRGIKYESLIPAKLTNVLIAGKCYGSSQIFLSASRVNKDMFNLGYAAGNAAILYFSNNLTDVRNVNIADLQTATGIIADITTMTSKLA